MFQVTEFNQPIIFEVNIDQKVNMCTRSITKVVFLKSSLFIQLNWNLKVICTSGEWINQTIIFEVSIYQKVNISQRSTTSVRFLKSSIVIRLTWNLKSIYISGHWIQPANYFEVHTVQKVNIGRVSKTVNFHLIDVKFEEELYICSVNYSTNCFWGQTCFMDFASIVRRTTSFCHFCSSIAYRSQF